MEEIKVSNALANQPMLVADDANSELVVAVVPKDDHEVEMNATVIDRLNVSMDSNENTETQLEKESYAPNTSADQSEFSENQYFSANETKQSSSSSSSSVISTTVSSPSRENSTASSSDEAEKNDSLAKCDDTSNKTINYDNANLSEVKEASIVEKNVEELSPIKIEDLNLNHGSEGIEKNFHVFTHEDYDSLNHLNDSVSSNDSTKTMTSNISDLDIDLNGLSKSSEYSDLENIKIRSIDIEGDENLCDSSDNNDESKQEDEIALVEANGNRSVSIDKDVTEESENSKDISSEINNDFAKKNSDLQESEIEVKNHDEVKKTDSEATESELKDNIEVKIPDDKVASSEFNIDGKVEIPEDKLIASEINNDTGNLSVDSKAIAIETINHLECKKKDFEVTASEVEIPVVEVTASEISNDIENSFAESNTIGTELKNYFEVKKGDSEVTGSEIIYNVNDVNKDSKEIASKFSNEYIFNQDLKHIVEKIVSEVLTNAVSIAFDEPQSISHEDETPAVDAAGKFEIIGANEVDSLKVHYIYEEDDFSLCQNSDVDEQQKLVHQPEIEEREQELFEVDIEDADIVVVEDGIATLSKNLEDELKVEYNNRSFHEELNLNESIKVNELSDALKEPENTVTSNDTLKSTTSIETKKTKPTKRVSSSDIDCFGCTIL